MAKGPKTSASPATQKKHARKKAVAQGLPLPKPKKSKDKSKGKGKEPRKKVYIPPFKPAPVQPDPLESLGLASRLPPELVIVYRKLAKKDPITKGKALEELQTEWFGKIGKRVVNGYDAIEANLLVALPVWVSLTSKCHFARSHLQVIHVATSSSSVIFASKSQTAPVMCFHTNFSRAKSLVLGTDHLLHTRNRD